MIEVRIFEVILYLKNFVTVRIIPSFILQGEQLCWIYDVQVFCDVPGIRINILSICGCYILKIFYSLLVGKLLIFHSKKKNQFQSMTGISTITDQPMAPRGRDITIEARHTHKSMNTNLHLAIYTPDMRQSKMLLTIDKCRSKNSIISVLYKVNVVFDSIIDYYW